MVPIERALLTMVGWVMPALAFSIVGLAIPATWPTTTVFLGQLALLALWGLGLSANLAAGLGASDNLWFASMSGPVRRMSTAIGLVALSTFGTILVALASSAALRFHPSTQFLQLISAADIAWVVAGVMMGLAMRTPPKTWLAAGVMIALICAWSLYRYLAEVGFGPEGEWIVRSEELWRLVIPFDIAAAVIAVASIWFGSRSPEVMLRDPNPDREVQERTIP